MTACGAGRHASDHGEGGHERAASGGPGTDLEDELAGLVEHARRTAAAADHLPADLDLTGVLRRVAESARTQQQWLKASGAIAVALRSPGGADPLQLIVAGIGDCTRAGLVAVLRPSGTSLRVDAVRGTGAAGVLGRLLPLHGSPAGTVFTTGAPQRHAGAAAGSPVPPALDAGPLMIVPLGSRSGITGVLVIAVAPGDTTAFTAEELDLATRLARRAGLGLEIAQAGPGQRRTAMEAEQERTTEELHRRAIQRLFGLGLSLHGLAAVLDPGRVDRVLTMVDLLDATTRRIRSSVFDAHAVAGSGGSGTGARS